MEDLANSFQKVKIHLEQENSQFKFQLEAQKLDMENELESLLKLKEKEQLEKTEENHSNLLVLEMKVGFRSCMCNTVLVNSGLCKYYYVL